MESTLQGAAMVLFSDTSAAAVTCAIMKPEFTPLFSTRKAGRPLIFGSTRTAVRRSDRLPISAIARARVSAAKRVGVLHAGAIEMRGADRASGNEIAVLARRGDLAGLAAHLMDAIVERRVAALQRVNGHCARHH